MKTTFVKDLMVPLSEYETIADTASLAEAVATLEEARQRYAHKPRRLGALLVTDAGDRVVGKLSPLDVLMALEPTYKKLYSDDGFSSLGIAREEIERQVTELGLWRSPMPDICRQSSGLSVRDVMDSPAHGETVDEGANLTAAMHQLLVGFHQALLVMRGDEIVGVLRLDEVHDRVAEILRTCTVH